MPYTSCAFLRKNLMVLMKQYQRYYFCVALRNPWDRAYWYSDVYFDVHTCMNFLLRTDFVKLYVQYSRISAQMYTHTSVQTVNQSWVISIVLDVILVFLYVYVYVYMCMYICVYIYIYVYVYMDHFLVLYPTFINAISAVSVN